MTLPPERAVGYCRRHGIKRSDAGASSNCDDVLCVTQVLIVEVAESRFALNTDCGIVAGAASIAFRRVLTSPRNGNGVSPLRPFLEYLYLPILLAFLHIRKHISRLLRTGKVSAKQRSITEYTKTKKHRLGASSSLKKGKTLCGRDSGRCPVH